MNFIMLRAIAAKLNRLMFAISQRAGGALGLTRRTHASSRSASQDTQVDSRDRLLFEHSFNAIVTTNSRHEIVAANSSAQIVFGSAVSVIPVPVDRFIRSAADRSTGEPRGISHLLEREDIWMNQTIPALVVRADGRHAPTQLRVVATDRSDTSGLILFLGTSSNANQSDTTYDSQFEASRDFLENMPDGMFQSRRDGTILAANSAMVRLLGYASDDDLLRNANVRDICLFPEQRDALLNRLAKHGTVRDAVIEVSRKDLTERTVRADIVQIPGGPGQETILQGTLRDVTDQPDVEVPLHQSEEHIRALADHTPDLLTVIDENAEFIYCGPSSAAMLGYDSKDICGTSVFDLVHPDDNEALSYFVIETLRDPGIRNSVTFRCQHRDGKYINLESVSSSFVSDDGKPQGVIISRDVSRRLSRDHQRQQAHKLQALGQLAGGIAHDFNNLFTAVIGSLQMIGESGPAGNVEEQVATAIRAVMRGSALTGRLLGFARRQPLRPELVNLGDLVTGLEPALKRALGDSMEISISCDDALWPVQVDPAQLESAIFDLAINSRDATNAQGTLSVQIQNRDAIPAEFDAKFSNPVRECVCISVADDGSGMSEETRRRATEPFYTTKTQGTATGMGLSTVYGFVCQSDGYFRIQNRRPKGTRVDILLPRASEPPAADSPSADSPELARGDETILVVDDNADVRNTTIKLLSQLGYKVLGSSGGSDALKVLVSRDVDLLLTDIRMPGMTGLELANEVRDQFPQVGILLTSGFLEEPIRSTNPELTEQNFLPKPYNKENLAKRLRAVLDKTK